MSHLQEQFNEFHKKNPQVYEMFRRFTYQAIDAGRKDFGAKCVVERIRWSSMVETTGDTFKINNNFTSFYARMFMDSHPEHYGLFQTRIAAADNKGITIDEGERV